jgi:acetyl esterase/lipase
VRDRRRAGGGGARAGAGVLRDESIDFAARLCRAAVPTELHVYAGAVHGFDMFADTAVARTAARDSADWLARQFNRPTVA